MRSGRMGKAYFISWRAETKDEVRASRIERCSPQNRTRMRYNKKNGTKWKKELRSVGRIEKGTRVRFYVQFGRLSSRLEDSAHIGDPNHAIRENNCKMAFQSKIHSENVVQETIRRYASQGTLRERRYVKSQPRRCAKYSRKSVTVGKKCKKRTVESTELRRWNPCYRTTQIHEKEGDRG